MTSDPGQLVSRMAIAPQRLRVRALTAYIAHSMHALWRQGRGMSTIHRRQRPTHACVLLPSGSGGSMDDAGYEIRIV